MVVQARDEDSVLDRRGAADKCGLAKRGGEDCERFSGMGPGAE